jgi:S-adenosylmethionine:tRNA ribosyltransferase-isomerase
VKLSEFDYQLSADRIAHEPARERDAARLMVHDVQHDRTEHRRVRDLPALLAPGDLLVVNDTRVLPARVLARRASGGVVELLLCEPAPPHARAWRALVHPARKLRAGERLLVEGGPIVASMIERPRDAQGRPAKEWLVDLFDPEAPECAVPELLERVGRVPLPPYIVRSARPSRACIEADRVRYQTVYARASGAVAAPTAGLHFTPELLERLERAGVERCSVTLHVGQGTFEPVQVEDVREHRMHAERFVLPESTADAVRQARARGGRVVAVGTSTVRVLETCAGERGEVLAERGETRLFLLPGCRFRVVDALLTNFHLPRSTLLMLVSAFAGRERVLRLYHEAVQRGYRFYSFGDAQLYFGQARDLSAAEQGA